MGVDDPGRLTVALGVLILWWEFVGDEWFGCEAIFEKEMFSKIDKLAKENAILATNTSTLDIDQIAEATSRPENVIGTHFFSPANVMKLLEITLFWVNMYQAKDICHIKYKVLSML